MKASSLKAKGRRLQNKICKELAELIGVSYGKDEDIAPREMGQSGPDCRFSKKVRELLRISIECKNQEKWNINQFVKQAKEQAYPETEWVVVVSKNRQKEPYVVISWEFFKVLLRSFVENNRD